MLSLDSSVVCSRAPFNIECLRTSSGLTSLPCLGAAVPRLCWPLHEPGSVNFTLLSEKSLLSQLNIRIDSPAL